MAVRDSRRDIVVGRDAELARARAVVRTRREQSQVLFITGPTGIGKTSLAEAALVGLDAEIIYLRGTPLDRHGPFETAINNIATFEQSVRFEPIREQIAEIVAAGYRELPTGRDIARTLISVVRTLPDRERATVIVFENLHFFDEYTLQATALLARQNHLFDQPYLILGRSGYPYPDFEGLPHIRLGPLDDEAARAALSHWSELVVPTVVAASLNASCDGNPLILREVAASLTPPQLQGDIALPAPFPCTPAIDECLAEVFDEVADEDLPVLAAFCLDRALPVEVVRAALPDGAADGLVERGLLTSSTRKVRLDQAALGWTAWHRIGAEERARVAHGLVRAWSSVDPLMSARYRVLHAPLTPEVVTEVREVLCRTDDAVAAAELREAVAELAFRSPTELDVRQGLRWIDACLEAEHLAAAIEAWPMVAAARRGSDHLLELARCRALLAGLSGDPVLELAGPEELDAIGTMSRGDAFVAWVMAARGAVRAGAVQQARRYLDQAKGLSQDANLTGRTLWRVVDCAWQVAVGRSLSAEALLEATARWCEHAGGQHWYDDTIAIGVLTDLGEHDSARQFLITCEARHSRTRGMAQIGLLACRLHLELADYRMEAAQHAADNLSRHTLSASLHAPRLHADLLRLHAFTGWSGPALHAAAAQPGNPSTEPVLAVALGQKELLAGNYVAAANLLGSALAAPCSCPIGQWELLADLVEALVASGGRAAGVVALDGAPAPEPRSPAAAAAAGRARALVAPSYDLRRAFAHALEVSGPPLPLFYRARALLAYARRLAQLGIGQEPDQLRNEAADLFTAQGLLGWHQHAAELTLDDDPADPIPAMVNDQLSPTENELLRLLLEGRRNKEIAEELYVSLRTVEKLLTRLYRHFEVDSKRELLEKLRGT